MREQERKSKCRMYSGSEGFVCISGRGHSLKALAVAAMLLAAVSGLVVAGQSVRSQGRNHEELTDQQADAAKNLHFADLIW